MFNSEIKKEVMRVINERILKAEQEHEAECKRLEEECETKKRQALQDSVRSIIGKFL